MTIASTFHRSQSSLFGTASSSDRRSTCSPSHSTRSISFWTTRPMGSRTMPHYLSSRSRWYMTSCTKMTCWKFFGAGLKCYYCMQSIRDRKHLSDILNSKRPHAHLYLCMKAYQITVLLGDNCPSAGSCLCLTGPLYSTSVVVLRDFMADMSVDCEPIVARQASIDRYDQEDAA
jgi:hypothetical protein